MIEWVLLIFLVNPNGSRSVGTVVPGLCTEVACRTAAIDYDRRGLTGRDGWQCVRVR
jgi:hypothetical protein